jgi:hypothetical protein
VRAVHELLQHYTQLAISQLVQTAACNLLHSLEQRCCRWLLIAHDSAQSDTFALTHELLALILGVQRPSVSPTIGLLRKAGCIDYRSGHVTIRDRSGIQHNVLSAMMPFTRVWKKSSDPDTDEPQVS